MAASPVTQGLKVIASIQVKDDKRGEGGRRHTRSVGLFTLKTDCVIKIAPDRLLQKSQGENVKWFIKHPFFSWQL